MRRYLVGYYVGASYARVPQHRLLRRAPRQVHREVMALSRDAPRTGDCIVKKNKDSLLRYCVLW